MEEAVGAEKGERTPNRQGYRAGYYGRTLVTRVGKLELRVPQDRQGRFRNSQGFKELAGYVVALNVPGFSSRREIKAPAAVGESSREHVLAIADLSQIGLLNHCTSGWPIVSWTSCSG
jgi:hypothetical protein